MAEIKTESVFMNHRVFEPALEMVREMEKLYREGKLGTIEAALNKFNEVGMKGLAFADAACVFPGWLAARDKRAALLAQPKTEENAKRLNMSLEEWSAMTDDELNSEAVRWADFVVSQTQPGTRELDLMPIFRDNRGALPGIFLQFQVPMAVLFQQLFIDTPVNIRREGLLKAMAMPIAFTITAIATGMMSSPPEDDEDKARWLLGRVAGDAVSTLPALGSMLSKPAEDLIRGNKAFMYQNNFPLLDTGIKAVNNAIKGEWEKAAEQGVTAISYATGLPDAARKEYWKAFKDAGDNPLKLLQAMGIKNHSFQE
jgi:hypothetical protein